MAKWLYDSRGTPIAFISGKHVFSDDGNFIGNLEDGKVWNGQYIGEIYREDRRVRRTNVMYGLRGLPGLPGIPGLPGLPGLRSSIMLPLRYEDVKIDQD
jgi:hypothetical protein